MRKAPVGIDKPTLDRKRAWGYWHVSRDGRVLVFDREISGNYQVPLAELRTVDDCTVRVAQVVALKDGWVDQRVLDDLVRALRALVHPDVPKIDLSPRG